MELAMKKERRDYVCNMFGEVYRDLCVAFSQLERETIAERFRDNMHELAKMGRRLGGNAHFAW